MASISQIKNQHSWFLHEMDIKTDTAHGIGIGVFLPKGAVATLLVRVALPQRVLDQFPSGKESGPQVCLMFYKAFTREVDRLQYKDPRLVTDALSSTPIQAPLSQCNEAPLKIRRKILAEKCIPKNVHYVHNSLLNEVSILNIFNLTHSYSNNQKKSCFSGCFCLSTSNAPEVVDPLQTDLDQRPIIVVYSQLNEVMAKYPTPENCPFFIPPKLNAQIRAALNEADRKKDERLVARQKEVGIALTAVAIRAQSILLNRPDEDEETSSLIEREIHLYCVEYTSLILCIQKGIGSSSFEHFYLFGEDLGERIKTAKSIGKSVALKAGSSKAKYAPQTLKAHNPNFLGPLRQKKYKPQRRSGQNRYYQESRSQFPKEEETRERERGRKFPPRKFNNYDPCHFKPEDRKVVETIVSKDCYIPTIDLKEAYFPIPFAKGAFRF
ncbi:unnamed protein product [Ceutorhynchus assimilis]|uniref:Uncharacterized protein n=1 Tax=Ceutorhynchus assimilis TaxID=467358 RepID=A0A9N9ML83_9CUCU|nr:unnamed protein product [Ceutorhynchus assimilis]